MLNGDDYVVDVDDWKIYLMYNVGHHWIYYGDNTLFCVYFCFCFCSEFGFDSEFGCIG
jgi:hypothetical protein